MRIRIPFRRTETNRSVDGAIERFRRRRLTRPMIGIHVPSSFERIDGTVCGVRGSGKWMQVQSMAFDSHPLSDALRDGCRTSLADAASWRDTIGTGIDLGEACAELCESLIGKSGLSFDDILVVSIDEPGVRWSDYDGRLEYSPLLQPQRLVERTGLNVVDAFPAADVASGGRGGPLSPLAHWFLFSDRGQPIAERWRFLAMLDEQCTLIRLPPSDGLDAELPDIRAESMPGLGVVEALLCRASERPDEQDLHGALAVQGKSISSLRDRLADNVPRQPWRPWCQVDSSIQSWMHEQALAIEQVASHEGISWEDALCSATLAVVDTIRLAIDSHSIPEGHPIDLIVAGRGNANGLIMRELREMNSSGEVHNIDETGIRSEALQSTCAAVLGLMHIDQMPASLPWLTGSLIPRLHGRVTPGRPVHWRRLVTEMADYHPPAMKLRDAV